MHLYPLSRPFLEHFLGTLCSGPPPLSAPGLKCRSRCHLGCHVGCHLGGFFDPSTAFGGLIWLEQRSREALGSVLLPFGALLKSKRGTNLFRVAFWSRVGCREGSFQGHLRLILPPSPLVLNWPICASPSWTVGKPSKSIFIVTNQ